ncbi:exo-beta-1,3-glucanase [Phaeospirillum tilakii]|uniref:Endo-1,3-beta-glucanase btgC n=1 Tax=Phaeospirillum tilakii TaxID=741673 RepID=A0ABW5CFC5_9PROT
MNRLLAVLVVAVLAALQVALWGWANRPVPLGLSFDEPFPSVSFAPFQRGQSPLTHDYPTPAQVAADLGKLVGVAKGVRTYTSLEGMEVVPEEARRLGIEVTHSAWLGQRPEVNRREIEALVAAANTYPDVIKRVIVGNEVLLRQDLPVDELILAIRSVKSRVRQPVSYADVWAFWLKNPQLADEVDFITIHILPYWEDEPIAVEDSAKHIVEIYRRVAAAFPGKPILIGEAGWPTRGRSRGPAVANIENGAAFVRTLARVSKENGFDYNVVEAFDQPWKAQLEGTVGAKWGVEDIDRRVKFRMSGPVEPSPFWPTHAAAAAGFGSLLGLAALLRARARYRLGAGLTVALLTQILGGLAVWQAVNAQALAFDLTDQCWALVRIGVQVGFALVLARAAVLALAAEAPPPADRWGERLCTLYGVAAITASALLLIDGRYRDIPCLEFLVPCLGLTAYALARRFTLGLGWVEAFAVGRIFAGGSAGGMSGARTMALGLGLAALAGPLSEAVALARGADFIAAHPSFAEQIPFLLRALWINHEMDAWTAMVLVMALPYLAEMRRQG